jgi:hypothetical protein
VNICGIRVDKVSKQAEIIEAVIAKAGSLRATARTLGYEPGYICELRKEHKPMSLHFIQAVGTVYPDLIPMLGEYLWGSAYTNQGKGRHGASSFGDKIAVRPGSTNAW